MRTFLHPRLGAAQTDEDRSFVGGIPLVPAGTPIPTCALCGADLTFFFQVAFPSSHHWQGHSLSVFACTATADDDSDGEGDDQHLIPADPYDGPDVSRDFLEEYQRAFRFLVFETAIGEPLDGYVEKIAFAPLEMSRKREGAIGFLNDKPQWRLDDESPTTVAGSRTAFLLELFREIVFPTVEGAPPQMVPGLDGSPAPSNYTDSYSLFVANEIYLFGPKKPDSAVCVLIQK
jgi:hypothetical protein